jgi:type IX secretion system PorP/SprF family membrane protein
MKKILLVIVLFQLSILADAQQLPQWSQYMLNQYGMNPAAIEPTNCVEVRAGQRIQWMGFEGAPQTAFFSGNGFLPSRSSLNRGKHGVGLYLERDEHGFFSRKSAYGSYSYHKIISRNMWLGLGFFAGFMQYGFNSPNLNLNVTPDDAVTTAASVLLYPDICPGIWLSSKKIYAGLSIKSVVGNKLTKVHGLENRLTRHLYATAGYRMLSNDKKQAYEPSFCLRFSPMGPPSLDLSYRWQYKNILGLGAGYRVGEAINAMVKINLIRILWLGYSYDYPLNKIRLGSIQTHEVILGLKLCKGKDREEAPDVCPAYH